MEIYAVKVTGRIESWVFDKLLSYLPQERINKINRFLRREDAQRALMGDILARTAICRGLNIRNSEILLASNDYGKPFLKSIDNFYFNVSHAGEWVVCAAGDARLGIDVEEIKPIDFDIAERFFSREECSDLFMRSEAERLGYFFDLWTLKESYIKAEGRGLSIPLDSFTFKIQGDDIRITTNNEFRDCFFKQYDIGRNYKLAVCSTDRGFPEDIRIKSYMVLYEEFLQVV
ncbi:MAG: 4'-phosphopantetheinyl transferase superfamily protein [Clostridia bacterium]|nr:4'-phosphopantetheinyl transferase superfamily protein [Clostridia bacterium]